MKKFNWGHGLFVFYLLFLGTVFTRLFASFGVDRSLVADNYYEEDLAYQVQYNKIKNTFGEEISIVYNQSLSRITIQPNNKKVTNGVIHLYRPSDQSLDFSHVLEIEGKTIIATQAMKSGKWTLKLEWSEGSKQYYQEQNIFI